MRNIKKSFLRLYKSWWLRWTVFPLVIVYLGLQVMALLVFFPDEILDKSTASSFIAKDRNQHILRQEVNTSGLREHWKNLDTISPHLINATLASEDHRFYDHGGTDWRALGRALWLNIGRGKFAYGGSTLSMQVARMLKKPRRTLFGKFKQIVFAKRLEFKLSKDEILEHYLNRVYYGNGAWGAEQASTYYFGKSASDLSVGEASLLAVFPRGPEYYNPYRHWKRALSRRERILELMVKHSALDKAQASLAIRSSISLLKNHPDFLSPHFVEYVKEQLPSKFTSASTVETTLDLDLQRKVEVAVERHVRKLLPRHMSQAAAVVLRNFDGAILAMVGSRGYDDVNHNGAFNGVTARLRPGSTLKPFVYGTAIEFGETPSTMSFDVILPEDANQFYSKNVKQHGFARYRESLASSYNLSAVHALQRSGLDSVLNKLRKAGLATLDKPDSEYDWGLAIGHAEVRLLDLTSAFTTFARAGVPIKPRSIEGAHHVDGRIYEEDVSLGERVFSPEVAYQIYDILSDPDARKPMFGDRVPMNLPFKVALKTGTTKAYTDLWAVGVTKEYTVGVWGGNFDGSPTYKVKSVQGATPLMRGIYTVLASTYGNPTEVPRPETLVEEDICPLSGMKPGKHCDHRKKELFVLGKVPQEECTWHRLECGEKRIVYPEELKHWKKATSSDEDTLKCESTELVGKTLRIVSPVDGATFQLEAHRPPQFQRPPALALPNQTDADWFVDGVRLSEWIPTAGRHRLKIESENESDEITIFYQ